MYMIAVQGVRGEPFLLNNVLVTNGEGVGWGIPSHGGDFFEFWVLNTGFLCIIKFELTSTLAPKNLQMYMISLHCYKGWGETVSVVKWDTKGRVWEGDSPAEV